MWTVSPESISDLDSGRRRGRTRPGDRAHWRSPGTVMFTIAETGPPPVHLGMNPEGHSARFQHCVICCRGRGAARSRGGSPAGRPRRSWRWPRWRPTASARATRPMPSCLEAGCCVHSTRSRTIARRTGSWCIRPRPSFLFSPNPPCRVPACLVLTRSVRPPGRTKLYVNGHCPALCLIRHRADRTGHTARFVTSPLDGLKTFTARRRAARVTSRRSSTRSARPCDS